MSLTPAETVQYRLAGLELDEELPSVRDFPHRGLPVRTVPLKGRDRKGKGKAVHEHVSGYDGKEAKADEDFEVKQPRADRGPRLRQQHLSALTAILHRCLSAGDIPRATRAWAMLIRTQVSGRGVDLRGSGYWGIGAELLIKAHDRHRKPTYDSDEEEEEDVERDGNAVHAEKRWGTTEGLEKAKEYFERMILQHPYKRQFHDSSVSALDIWPVMVVNEIYEIQYQQMEGLRRIAAAEEAAEETGETASEGGEEVDDNFAEAEDDYGFTADQRRAERSRKRREERLWRARDKIRLKALAASEKIAATLDELMTTPPYSDSHELLRLRGMLAIYIGGLNVPEKPVEEDEFKEDNDEKLQRSLRLGSGGVEAERRVFYRQRIHDHERGRNRWEDEHERAKKIFDRIAKAGGDVSDIKEPGLDDQEFYDAEQ